MLAEIENKMVESLAYPNIYPDDSSPKMNFTSPISEVHINIEQLRDRFIQENIILTEVLKEVVKAQQIAGQYPFPSQYPYSAYVTGPRFGFMQLSPGIIQLLEMLARPIIEQTMYR